MSRCWIWSRESDLGAGPIRVWRRGPKEVEIQIRPCSGAKPSYLLFCLKHFPQHVLPNSLYFFFCGSLMIKRTKMILVTWRWWWCWLGWWWWWWSIYNGEVCVCLSRKSDQICLTPPPSNFFVQIFFKIFFKFIFIIFLQTNFLIFFSFQNLFF